MHNENEVNMDTLKKVAQAVKEQQSKIAEYRKAREQIRVATAQQYQSSVGGASPGSYWINQNSSTTNPNQLQFDFPTDEEVEEQSWREKQDARITELEAQLGAAWDAISELQQVIDELS